MGDTATDRQYGQAVADAAKDVEMTAHRGVSWNPIGRGRQRADLEGQTDAQVGVGGLSADRSTRRWHQGSWSV
jgi:hypothetical protein